MGLSRELTGLARYLAALDRFLREPLTEEECRRRIYRRLEQREGGFLRILADGVFANPRSPYRALFRSAGIELRDAERLVRDNGLERALERLYDEGVRVTLDEFRGRSPVRRNGL